MSSHQAITSGAKAQRRAFAITARLEVVPFPKAICEIKFCMLPRHKKAMSDIKSAHKKLKDAQNKYAKTRAALAKARKEVEDAKARLSLAQERFES